MIMNMKILIKKGQVAITKDSEKRNDIGIPTFIALKILTMLF